MLKNAIEPAYEAGELRRAANRQQRPRDVRLRASSAVVLDREALVLAPEANFQPDRVAGQAQRVDLRRIDRQSPRQLARSAARRVDLLVGCDVDDLRRSEMLRRLDRESLQQGRGDREV